MVGFGFFGVLVVDKTHAVVEMLGHFGTEAVNSAASLNSVTFLTSFDAFDIALDVVDAGCEFLTEECEFCGHLAFHGGVYVEGGLVMLIGGNR